MSYQAILYDFDGTLVDTLPGIEAAVIRAAGDVVPRFTLPLLRPLIGPPLTRMLEIALPDATQAEREAVAARFRELYDGGICCECEIYAEVATTLHAVHAGPEAPRAFLVTNKRGIPTHRLLEYFGIADVFEAVMTCDSPRPFSSKVETVSWTLSEFRLDPARCLMVGDSTDDYEASRQNGLDFFGVSYGYGDAARYTCTAVLDRFDALSGFLSATAA